LHPLYRGSRTEQKDVNPVIRSQPQKDRKGYQKQDRQARKTENFSRKTKIRVSKDLPQKSRKSEQADLSRNTLIRGKKLVINQHFKEKKSEKIKKKTGKRT